MARHIGFWFAMAALSYAPPVSAMSVCSGGQSSCVIDGDTFILDRTHIRIANIDAPELKSAKCDAEKRLAIVARNRLAALLSAGAINVAVGDPRDGRTHDRHGRVLAIISVAGEDVGEALVAESLARRWTGHRNNWC